MAGIADVRALAREAAALKASPDGLRKGGGSISKEADGTLTSTYWLWDADGKYAGQGSEPPTWPASVRYWAHSYNPADALPHLERLLDEMPDDIAARFEALAIKHGHPDEVPSLFWWLVEQLRQRWLQETRRPAKVYSWPAEPAVG